MAVDLDMDTYRMRVHDLVMIVNPVCTVDSNFSMAYDGDSDNDSSTPCDNDIDGDSGSVYHQTTRTVTYLYTYRKKFVISGEDNDPMFSVLDYFVSLAVDYDSFEADSANDV